MIDGDLKITQSLAIMKYIARKYNLTGLPENACPVALAKADMIEQQLNDLRYVFVPDRGSQRRGKLEEK